MASGPRTRTFAPNEVTPGSNKKVWWKCRFAHEWQATVSNRTLGRGCPYCANKKVDRSNCLTTTHPQLVAEWHPTRNGDLRSDSFTAGSGKRIWWKCPAVDDHEMGNQRSVIELKATTVRIAVALRLSIPNLSRNGIRRKTAT